MAEQWPCDCEHCEALRADFRVRKATGQTIQDAVDVLGAAITQHFEKGHLNMAQAENRWRRGCAIAGEVWGMELVDAKALPVLPKSPNAQVS